jgi:hypothetical protein
MTGALYAKLCGFARGYLVDTYKHQKICKEFLVLKEESEQVFSSKTGAMDLKEIEELLWMVMSNTELPGLKHEDDLYDRGLELFPSLNK